MSFLRIQFSLDEFIIVFPDIPCAGLVIGAWPHEPDVAAVGNLDALARLGEVRAVLPAGAGALGAEEFESMSAAAFDAQWVTSLAC